VSVGRGRKSGPLDAIALKCLAKKPAQRYATAGELAEEFARVAAGDRPLVKRGRRRFSGWLLMIALVLVLLGIGITITAGRESTASAKPDQDKLPPQNETVIQLPSIVNSLGMRFVRIPAGSFTMGSPPQERGHNYAEEQKLVHISEPFSLAVTETTQDVYQKVMQTVPGDLRFRGPTLPVGGVAYADALEFCRRLALMDHHRYRLPSEEEWEYACRASSDAKAMSTPQLRGMAWFAENSGGVLHPVASLAPNRWGLYDMLGGVSEWCTGTVESNPKTTPATIEFGIIRGGAYDSSLVWCRSASRRLIPRGDSDPDVGFRVILEP
jgi:formylglycine-generating enzyme required for sulfatase activity